MPLNLNQARRLHDRDPNNPARCAICHYIDGDNWPCATATALGATGRSEWLDTPTRPDHDGPCTCGHARGTHKQDVLCRNCDCDTYQEDTPSPDCVGPHPHPGHCTTPNDPDVCGDTGENHATHPCVLAADHFNEHTDRNGNRWA